MPGKSKKDISERIKVYSSAPTSYYPLYPSQQISGGSVLPLSAENETIESGDGANYLRNIYGNGLTGKVETVFRFEMPSLSKI